MGPRPDTPAREIGRIAAGTGARVEHLRRDRVSGWTPILRNATRALYLGTDARAAANLRRVAELDAPHCERPRR